MSDHVCWSPRMQAPPPLAWECEESRSLVLQLALKCADLSQLTIPHTLHRRGVAALEKEFFAQARVGPRPFLLGPHPASKFVMFNTYRRPPYGSLSFA